MTSPDDLATLTQNVADLTASVRELSRIVATDKERLARQRKRDIWVGVGLLAIIVGGGVAQAVDVQSQQSTCHAVNVESGVIRDLFEPFKSNVQTLPVPAGVSAKVRAQIEAANARAAAQSKAFFADLERRTQSRSC